MVKERTLIIDGDVLVFKASVAAEEKINWGDGIYSMSADYKKAVSLAKSFVTAWKQELIAFRDPVICFSDTTFGNWRKDILPTYKANRGTSKPLVYWEVRKYLESNYDTTHIHMLEGDDVCGIEATGPGLNINPVLVSIDKDMAQIPVPYWNCDTGEMLLADVNSSIYYHMYQTLVGDRVDNYFGCPGIGPKRADKILLTVEPTGLFPLEYESLLWGLVLGAYQKAGLTKDAALVQARVSRILTWDDYNPLEPTLQQNHGVKLWTPKQVNLSN